MEDFYETKIDGVNGEMVGLFGVFDGICQPLFVNLHISCDVKFLNVAFQNLRIRDTLPFSFWRINLRYLDFGSTLKKNFFYLYE